MARRVTSGKAASALAIRASNDRGKAGAASNYLYINYLYKYFFKKDATLYTFIAERQSLFHAQVFNSIWQTGAVCY